MKVLIIGGNPYVNRLLASYSEFSVSILTDTSRCEARQQEAIYTHVVPYQPRAKLDIRAIRQVYQAVQQIRPDLIHAYYARPLAHVLIATQFLSPRPKIVSFRGTANQLSHYDITNQITYLHSRVVAHACESEAVRQSMIESGIPAEQCFPVFNCTVPGRFPRPGRTGLAALGIPEEAFVVGTIANMRPVKGIDILLRAAIECADLPKLNWILFGHVMDRRVLRLARDERLRSIVRLTGFRSDARALISGADLFVMPSRNEGLCTALLEAMAQRVCPIVSDAGGMKEVVRHGIDGLVVPKENVSALAAAIRLLYANRARVHQFAESAEQRVTEAFSPERMAERLRAVYLTVVADHSEHFTKRAA